MANYLSTFTRVAQLQQKQMQPGQIAFLLRRGRSLVRRYLELLQVCERDKNMAYHLEELMHLGSAGVEKKSNQGGRRDGK